jgi:hypothetical protein
MIRKRQMTGILVLCLSICIIFSGCLSLQNEKPVNNTAIKQTSSGAVTPQPMVTKYSVRIDPIRNYTMDSSFNITGSSELIVNGTTDLPSGTVVHLAIFGLPGRNILSTKIEIKGSVSGPNSFSYIYDLKGIPPGRYRIKIDTDDLVLWKTAYTDFEIISDVQYYKSIKMDPPTYSGDRISISGITDLPAGSEILINSHIEPLGCANEAIWNNGYVTKMCNGECSEIRQIIPVVEGTGRTNTWNLTANFTMECKGHYTTDVKAVNWTNATAIHLTNF